MDREAKWKKYEIPKIKKLYRLLIYSATAILSVLSAVIIDNPQITPVLKYLIYWLAASGLCVSSLYFWKDVQGIKERIIRPGMKKNPLINRFVNDYSFRTILCANLSFISNLLFALSNCFFGIYYRSVWFAILAGYYIILSIMRFLVLRHAYKMSLTESGRELKNTEKVIHKRCGILLVIMALVLAAAVYLMTCQDRGKNYGSILVIAVAVYTFCKVVFAVKNLQKARHMKIQYLTTIRDIGYADALVSLLFLQTSMFSSLGTTDLVYVKRMNGATGTVVCLMVFLLGIYMVKKE